MAGRFGAPPPFPFSTRIEPMKNAVVLVHHVGLSGNVAEGRILRDVTETRFKELEAAGLVREATADDLKAGDQHQFEKDTSVAEPAAAANEKAAPAPENKAAPAPANKAKATPDTKAAS
jgi:hypothetical protein